MSRDLLRRGFKFVGSTICYALMQATGMVNDHLLPVRGMPNLAANDSRQATIGYPKEGAAITSRVAFQNPTLAS